jgi:hypothetical protein
VVLRRDNGEVVIRQQPHLGSVTRLSINQNAGSTLNFASGDGSGGVYIHTCDAESQQTQIRVRLISICFSYQWESGMKISITPLPHAFHICAMIRRETVKG